MKNKEYNIIKIILTLIFGSQLFVSGLVVIWKPSGQILNTLFLSVILFIYFKHIFLSINKKSICLLSLLILTWFMITHTSHYLLYNSIDLIFIIKLLFIFLSLQIGYGLSNIYNKNISDFIYIGHIIIIFAFVSLLLGWYFKIEAIDITYSNALVGFTVHPAITAMLISTSIPFIFFHKQYKNILNLICFALIFLTMRRTALIGTLPFFFNAFKERLNYKKLIILSFPILFILIYTINSSTFLNINADHRILSLFGDDKTGSGRIVFWNIIIQNWLNFEISEFIFGKGSDSVNQLLFYFYGSFIGAHSDYLDILYNYGVISFVLVILFQISLLLFIVINKNSIQSKEFSCSLCIVFYLIFNSFISGGSFDIQAAPLYFALGLCMGTLKQV